MSLCFFICTTRELDDMNLRSSPTIMCSPPSESGDFWRAQLMSASLFGLQYYFFTLYFISYFLTLTVWRACGTALGVRTVDWWHHKRPWKPCSCDRDGVGTHFPVKELFLDASIFFNMLFWGHLMMIVTYLFGSTYITHRWNCCTHRDLTENKHYRRY